MQLFSVFQFSGIDQTLFLPEFFLPERHGSNPADPFIRHLTEPESGNSEAERCGKDIAEADITQPDGEHRDKHRNEDISRTAQTGIVSMIERPPRVDRDINEEQHTAVSDDFRICGKDSHYPGREKVHQRSKSDIADRDIPPVAVDDTERLVAFSGSDQMPRNNLGRVTDGLTHDIGVKIYILNIGFCRNRHRPEGRNK